MINTIEDKPCESVRKEIVDDKWSVLTNYTEGSYLAPLEKGRNKGQNYKIQSIIQRKKEGCIN